MTWRAACSLCSTPVRTLIPGCENEWADAKNGLAFRDGDSRCSVKAETDNASRSALTPLGALCVEAVRCSPWLSGEPDIGTLGQPGRQRPPVKLVLLGHRRQEHPVEYSQGTPWGVTQGRRCDVHIRMKVLPPSDPTVERLRRRGVLAHPGFSPPFDASDAPDRVAPSNEVRAPARCSESSAVSST
jgi:hypothetical protein